MATLNVRNPADGQWIDVQPPVGPSGPAGPAGAAGPTAVSAETGNGATINATDGGIFVAGVTQAETDLLYVNVVGDTMTGALLLPDQIATPPTTAVVASATGYVDQLITVATVDPDPVADAPARDGLMWNVVGDQALEPPGYDQPISTYGTALYDETI